MTKLTLLIAVLLVVGLVSAQHGRLVRDSPGSLYIYQFHLYQNLFHNYKPVITNTILWAGKLASVELYTVTNSRHLFLSFAVLALDQGEMCGVRLIIGLTGFQSVHLVSQLSHSFYIK